VTLITAAASITKKVSVLPIALGIRSAIRDHQPRRSGLVMASRVAALDEAT
jgi:hypothetical protein